jgi:hypothetical protein
MINLEEKSEDLRNLEQNLAIYKESIREVAEEIIENKVSKYPVFVASREPVNIGRMIIDKEELALEWSIFASTLEEFVHRKIVTEDKLHLFRQNYKDPAQFICLFTLLGEDAAGFIFIPYD